MFSRRLSSVQAIQICRFLLVQGLHRPLCLIAHVLGVSAFEASTDFVLVTKGVTGAPIMINPALALAIAFILEVTCELCIIDCLRISRAEQRGRVSGCSLDLLCASIAYFTF